MVAIDRHDGSSTLWLAGKMVVYFLSFLGAVLIGLPYLFHTLGDRVLPRAEHPWLIPGLAQEIAGAVLGIGSLIGYTICSFWLVIFGKGPFVEFDPPQEFVATGPYRWVRNPIVLFLLTTVLGEAIYFGSVGILVLFLLGIPFAQFQATHIEEPRLTRRFGESYERYRKRVPRWVPRKPRDRSTAVS